MCAYFYPNLSMGWNNHFPAKYGESRRPLGSQVFRVASGWTDVVGNQKVKNCYLKTSSVKPPISYFCTIRIPIWQLLAKRRYVFHPWIFTTEIFVYPLTGKGHSQDQKLLKPHSRAETQDIFYCALQESAGLFNCERWRRVTRRTIQQTNRNSPINPSPLTRISIIVS